ncbi:Fork head domain [Trinorchestia longiramus]|nr:Fork head domain [Trinorchestia longiramus]
MESVTCVRSSSVSPPTSVVAPVAVKAIISTQQQQQQQQLGQQQVAAAVEQHQRLHQIYQLALAERLRMAAAASWPRPDLHPPLHIPPIQSPVPLPPPHPAYHPLYPYRFMVDPRALYRVPEEPKPQHSYIGLIAMAILSVPEKKLVLSEIYSYILDHYAYFRTRGPGWRNSIRHNLSLNDCFVKAGRSANGKGHYWAIHPANIDDFSRGDFRRRRAQRRVRRHMGLTVDDDSSPEPPPPTPPPALSLPTSEHHISSQLVVAPSRKRQFDVASLLAPDDHNDQVDQLLKSRRHCLKQEAPSTPTEESITTEDNCRDETQSPNRASRQLANNNWMAWPWRPQELAQLESSVSN